MCLSRHRPPTSPSLHSLPRQNQVTITVVLKTPDGIPIKLRHASISILTLWKVTANPAQATYQTLGHRAPYRLAIAQLLPRINTDSERIPEPCGCLRWQVTPHHPYYQAVPEAPRHAHRVVG